MQVHLQDNHVTIPSCGDTNKSMVDDYIDGKYNQHLVDWIITILKEEIKRKNLAVLLKGLFNNN